MSSDLCNARHPLGFACAEKRGHAGDHVPIPDGTPLRAPLPSSGDADLRVRAFELYRSPFRFETGYVFDAKGAMVADQGGIGAMARVRGWGRIQKLVDADKLQDEVGALMAEALTNLWRQHGY